jgi:hypothetical protein
LEYPFFVDSRWFGLARLPDLWQTAEAVNKGARGFGPALFPGTADLPIQMIAVYALTINAPAKCADECDAEFARAS